jgi:hypothetical protein
MAELVLGGVWTAALDAGVAATTLTTHASSCNRMENNNFGENLSEEILYIGSRAYKPFLVYVRVCNRPK